jgi:hypothetical protein
VTVAKASGLMWRKAELFKLLAHVLHAHAAGKRRIDIHRLFSDPGTLCPDTWCEGAHVVQTISKLDEQNAHILGDRQKQLAQVLRLLGLLGDEIELLDLGQALDKRADIRTKQLVDLGAGRRGVLDRIVQQSDSNRRFVEMHLGEDRCDFERMGNIRIAARTLLLAMLSAWRRHTPC